MVLCRPAVAGLLAGVVLLSGCGDDPATPAPAPPAQPAAAAPAKAAAAAAPAAAAERAAEKITLVATDLPGFVEERGGKVGDMSPAQRMTLERFNECVEVPAQDEALTDLGTANFSHAETLDSVSSSVDVLGDPAAAEQLYGTLTHPKVDTCISNLLSETFSLESGGTVFVTDLVGTPLSTDQTHGVASQGRRVVAAVSAPRGVQLDITMDIFLLRHKSTVTSLTLTGEDAFTTTDRRRLVDLLSKRMAASAV